MLTSRARRPPPRGHWVDGTDEPRTSYSPNRIAGHDSGAATGDPRLSAHRSRHLSVPRSLPRLRFGARRSYGFGAAPIARTALRVSESLAMSVIDHGVAAVGARRVARPAIPEELGELVGLLRIGASLEDVAGRPTASAWRRHRRFDHPYGGLVDPQATVRSSARWARRSPGSRRPGRARGRSIRDVGEQSREQGARRRLEAIHADQPEQICRR